MSGSASASTSALGRAIHAETGDAAGWKTGASGAASASSMSLATAPVAPIKVAGDCADAVNASGED